MPELPEVETIKRDLEKNLLGKRIQEVIIHDRTALTGISSNGSPRRKISTSLFQKNILGKKVCSFKRRGKYIIMEFEGGSSLIVHLRMTGQLLIQKAGGKGRASFLFDDGNLLSFIDRRRFGEIFFSKDWRHEPSILSLGVEPLNGSLTTEYLKNQFSGRKAPIHSVLLNQKIVAGLGNIYSAEALYHSAISPLAQAQKIPLPKLERLISSIQGVLKKSIENRGYSMNTYVDLLGKKGKSQLFTAVYGKEGTPCKKCRKPLIKKTISGRGVVYCSGCQRP